MTEAARNGTLRLAYGDSGVHIALPAGAFVVEPRYVRGVADPSAELARALCSPDAGPPLRSIVQPGQTVALAICDGTRPQPRDLVVPAILEELTGVIDPGDVTILVATGTHRGNTADELRTMLGADVVSAVRVVNHDARASASLRWCGMVDDVPVWLNQEWLDADVRITTGFVEPHFFAGFSGGPKLVAPGLAGLETVLELHNARRIADPHATWGVTEGNPVHDAVRAIVGAHGAVDFALDVVLNREQRIVRAFAGELFAMHRIARDAVRDVAMQPVSDYFDVVVTTGSGFPLDQNLYQAVKGLSAAATIVRKGGSIICAAECRDGFPDHGEFRELLTSATGPGEVLAAIAERANTVPDQWQAQILARIQEHADVLMYTDGLTAEDLAGAHVGYVADLETSVSQALQTVGPGARLCVVPEGPQTIAYVA